MVGGQELHQQLKNLCFNTDWNYAVFWKLEHQPRMLLNCEDAYYDNNERYSRSKINWTARQYSVGEGIVGQVAAAGTHMWISEHQLVDEWVSQFTDTIRTVVFVAVGQYGVVELGSLDTITEDLKLVKHVREIFLEIRSSLMASANCSPCVTDLSTTSGYVSEDRTTTKKNSSDKRTMTETINNHLKIGNPKSDFTQSASYNDQNDKIINISDTSNNESFKFSAGCELFEALGPTFLRQNNRYDPEMMTADTPAETSGGSLLTQRSGAENLLESVVASVDCCYSDEKWSNSFNRPANGSNFHSLKRPREPAAKVGKKRARPGESRKPSPKDRQLIEDRLKELRQLVPNGSKCSIDSLLERTIKHMLFMQSITKHTNKIDKYAEFKLGGEETGIQHEVGSSWAIEVGNELKVCPITVENIGINGQMLIEMMSEECVSFLEIMEALRRMGLSILKGVTDVCGDKIWMCFIVEGKNNRGIHRVDILMSLIQLLELKTKT